MVHPLLLAIFLIIFADFGNAARILVVVPTPSVSHQIVFRPITQELAKRGHEVVVVTTDPAFPKGHAPENLTEIDVHDISYNVWDDNFYEVWDGKRDKLYNQIKSAYELFLVFFQKQLLSKEFQELIHNKTDYFDLLMIEAWARLPLALTHVFKVPVIQVSSFDAFLDNYDIVGAPRNTLLYPETTQQKLYNLTFWDKLKGLYTHYSLMLAYHYLAYKENAAMKKFFGHDLPSLNELANNVDMLFLNTYPVWAGNRPVPPNVVYLGGLPQKQEQQLPKHLQDYLDASKNGVVYVSFGTNVTPSKLIPEKVQVILNVLSKLPYDVLLKWDTETLPVEAKNIKLFKWLPQSDLLRHPKIKLFITQGGLQSIDEALNGGVPMLVIPLLGDQWYNAERYEHFGLGKNLCFETLTELELRTAIDSVIADDSYRKNIIRFREIVHDQPQSSVERALWWTEYVLRHRGAKHLRSPAANNPWVQYQDLDVYAVLVAALLVILIAIGAILYYGFKLVSAIRVVMKLKEE